MNELKDFIKLSKFAGERFDLVQAGGGNSSVKLDNGTMLIKASGVILSEVDEKKGYAIVDIKKITDLINSNEVKKINSKKEKEEYTKEKMQECNLSTDRKPSIETFLHAMMEKYTLHTHPITVNMIVSRKEWKEILQSIFSENILLVDYKTPGIELALELAQALQKNKDNGFNMPKIVFLQNHGLIVTSDVLEEVINITNEVVLKLEKFLNKDYLKYRQTNFISELINSYTKESYSTYLVEDLNVNKILNSGKEVFFNKPFCPDGVVFCGHKALEIQNDIVDEIKYHINNFGIPKIVIYKNNIYAVANNIKKAKEIEDVLKFQTMVFENNGNEILTLDDEEINYLENWDAEKFRQLV